MPNQYLRKNWVWISIVGIGVVVAGLYLIPTRSNVILAGDFACPSQAKFEPIAPIDDLVAEFALSLDEPIAALSTEWGISVGEPGPPAAVKWPHYVLLGLVDVPTKYREFIESLIGELACIIGLPITIYEAKNRARPNLRLYIVAPEQVSGRHGTPGDLDFRLLESSDCYTEFKFDAKLRIKKGDVYIRGDLSSQRMHTCISASLGHVLGLRLPVAKYIERTVFNFASPIVEKLTVNDKILIRTLYDRRIKPGMKRDDAVEIAREIIPELVRAVRERGVEALYQR